MNKKKITKFIWVFASWILISGLFDTITFLWKKDYHAFETNPLFILTGSIWFVLLYKFFVLSAMIYYIIWRSPDFKKNHWRFTIITFGVYVIIAQLLGGVSNLYVSAQQPDISQAMQPAQAISTYSYFALLLVYLPVLITILTFKIYEWSYSEVKQNVF